MAVRLSALRAGRPLPKDYSWYSFLLQAESTPGAIIAAEKIRPIEKSNDLTGSRKERHYKITIIFHKEKEEQIEFLERLLSLS
jgi:hypothetical protein